MGLSPSQIKRKPVYWHWGLFCKCFFFQAGIIADRLLIALEPEAASIYCKHQLEKSSIKPFATGSRYVILDAGGNVYTI